MRMLQHLCQELLHAWLPRPRPRARSRCFRENQVRVMKVKLKSNQAARQIAAVMALARLQASAFVSTGGLEASVTCPCAQATATIEVFVFRASVSVREDGMGRLAI